MSLTSNIFDVFTLYHLGSERGYLKPRCYQIRVCDRNKNQTSKHPQSTMIVYLHAFDLAILESFNA